MQATLHDMWETRPARPRDGAQIAGVAVAIGRRYSIDPVLVRIGFVVAAFYGIGAVLYLAGWALLPDEPGSAEPRRRPRLVLVIGLVIATVASVAALLRGIEWVLAGLVVLGLLFLLHRQRAGAPPIAGDPAAAPTVAVASPAPPPAPQPPAWDPLGAAPFAWDLPEPGPAQAPPPAPRRAPVTAVTLAAALLVGGVTCLAMLIGGSVDLPVLLGVVLAVLGTGLVAGAFLRTGRGIIPVAVLVSALTWAVVAAPWERWQGDVDEIRVVPATAAAVAPSYDHAAGSFELDLRDVDLSVPPGRATPPVRTAIGLGAGDVQVVVPRDADLTLRAEAGLGHVAFGQRESAGPGPSITVADDLGADGVRSGRPVVLDIEIGVGNVEVRRG